MKAVPREQLKGLWALLKTATPDSTNAVRRVLPLELHIILPARLAVVLMLYHSLHYSPWIRWVSSSLEVGVETVTSLYWVYVGGSAVMAILLLLGRRLPATLVRWIVIAGWLMDAAFLAVVTLITGGYDSFAYWIFVVLILRTVFLEPASVTQLIVNCFTAGCYLLAGLSDFVLAGNLDESARASLGTDSTGGSGEVLFMKTMLLMLVAVCGFGVQLLLERQHLADAEAREFKLRESQLHSVGRMAAEIAHQLKNPLAIINNATFSLGRSLGQNKDATSQSIGIIREEVERADRILTQVMDYSRLTEGRVEKLNISEALDAAIEEVFPAGVEFGIRVERRFPQALPPLILQRGHFHGTVVNLLVNAREALGESGVVQVEARSLSDGNLEIVVADDGPGVALEQRTRIFEAYYTTKRKGTGLGLAIVKNNVELYGGHVEVESELGKGTEFRVTFPTKS